jgi:hypothetical protein
LVEKQRQIKRLEQRWASAMKSSPALLFGGIEYLRFRRRRLHALNMGLFAKRANPASAKQAEGEFSGLYSRVT